MAFDKEKEKLTQAKLAASKCQTGWRPSDIEADTQEHKANTIKVEAALKWISVLGPSRPFQVSRNQSITLLAIYRPITWDTLRVRMVSVHDVDLTKAMRWSVQRSRRNKQITFCIFFSRSLEPKMFSIEKANRFEFPFQSKKYEPYFLTCGVRHTLHSARRKAPFISVQWITSSRLALDKGFVKRKHKNNAHDSVI